MLAERPLVFAGSANPPLAHAICAALGTEAAPCEVSRFPDGEVAVRLAVPVRGADVLLVQPTSPPVNDHLVELLAFVDACRRASAASVTVVVPYFGYARSDRRQGERVPVSASMVAELMEAVGVGHVVTVDVHSPQVEGFFRIPVDNLTAMPVLCEALAARTPPGAVIVAPDLGATKLATRFASRLGATVAVVHKLRRSAAQVTSAGLTGEVRGRRCIVVDDMITTGGTIESAIRTVRDAGAAEGITVAATHGVLTADAWDRLAPLGLEELLLTDTVLVAARDVPRTRIVPVAPMIAGVIVRARERPSRSERLFGSG